MTRAPRPLTVALAEARAAFDDSVAAFVAAVTAHSEWELLGPSRCHGWTRLDVAVHVIAGWREMLGGFVDVVDDEPTVDAASYWTAFAQLVGDEDPVEVLMSQRRRAAAYRRPASMVEELRDVAGAMINASRTMRDRPCRWQGLVFSPGDYLAIWAVENVVHHLDLLVDEPVPISALGLARATVDALATAALPSGWTDEQAVLIGTGRLPVPSEASVLGLPVLG